MNEFFDTGYDQETPGENPREREVMALFARRANASLNHSSEWREEARKLYDFAAGRQWDAEDMEVMKLKQRPMVTFNLVSKFIDAVVGVQINNRQTIRVYPRRNGAAALSDVATGALDWARDACDAEFEETDAGGDCLLTGMGWLETFLNDAVNPEGTIDKERRDPLEYLWDPMARKKNLADGRYVIRLRRFSADAWRETFGDSPPSLAFPGVDDNELATFMKTTDRDDYADTQVGMKADARGVGVAADYQWFETEDAYTVSAQFPEGPQSKTFSAKEWKGIEPKLTAAGIPYKAGEKTKRRVYFRAWVTGAGIHGGVKRLAYQHGFTHQAITGKRDRNKNLWYGIGRSMVDPQHWVNKFFSSILWQLSVNPKGGLLAESDAFEDENQAKASWADPSQITFVNPGALKEGKVEPKPNSNYPQGMDRLMTFTMDSIPQIVGINAELLGLTNRDQAGVVEAQRKQGALAIIAWFFDAMHRHYRESGRLTLCLIRDNIADERLIRVVGPEGAKYVPLTKQALMDDFDLIVDEAPTSVNMRERVAMVLEKFIPMALSAGISVPPEVLDYMPLPADLIEKWKAVLNKDPKQAELEQRGAAAGVAKEETAAQLNAAKAELAKAQAAEVAQTTPATVNKITAEAAETAASAGRTAAGE